MLYWIGYDDAGAVEACGDESVVTRFWCVVVPVRPIGSYYLSRDEDGKRVATPIALHRRSVIAGYLRTSVALAATIVSAPIAVAPGRWLYLWPLALALIALAAWLFLGYGRLDEAERERRALLRRVVGLGAPPELLPEASRAQIRDALADRWSEDHRPWADAIMAGTADEMLVAIAEYHALPALAEHARLNLARHGDPSAMWN